MINSPIFVDLDGVLCDFEQHYKNLTGDDWGGCFLEREDAPYKWERIESMDHFFLNMPWMKGAWLLWKALNANKPAIVLSAVSRTIPNCKEDKYQWCVRELTIPDERIILVQGKRNKKNYCTPGALLIDDHAGNRRQWIEAGGIAIWKNNPTETLEVLLRLGIC